MGISSYFLYRLLKLVMALTVAIGPHNSYTLNFCHAPRSFQYSSVYWGAFIDLL